MPEVKNVKISKVYEGKSGTGKQGAWTVYNLYFDGSENKFGWFGGKGKIVPVKGMQIASMEYEITENDGYTNHIIKKMVVAEGGHPASKPNPNPRRGTGEGFQEQGKKEVYLDHGKVVLTLLEMAGGVEAEREPFLQLVSLFWDGIQVILDASQKPAGKSEPRNDNTSDSGAEWEQGGDPGPEEDSIPF